MIKTNPFERRCRRPWWNRARHPAVHTVHSSTFPDKKLRPRSLRLHDALTCWCHSPLKRKNYLIDSNALTWLNPTGIQSEESFSYSCPSAVRANLFPTILAMSNPCSVWCTGSPLTLWMIRRLIFLNYYWDISFWQEKITHKLIKESLNDKAPPTV